MKNKNYYFGNCKKPTHKKSEDIIGHSGNTFWLLDGATPPLGIKNKKLTQQYINMLNHSISKNTVSVLTLKEILKNAIIDLRYEFNRICDLTTENYLPYSTVVLVRILENTIEYLVLADSYLSICVDGKCHVISDQRLKSIATKERAYVRSMREKGVSEISREYLESREKLINKELKFQNNVNGYWVASLDPEAAEHAIYGIIDYKENYRIIAASDGMERLVSVFGFVNSLDELINKIINEGEETIFDELRKLEMDNSNFLKPVSSTHDDASFFIVNG